MISERTVLGLLEEILQFREKITFYLLELHLEECRVMQSVVNLPGSWAQAQFKSAFKKALDKLVNVYQSRAFSGTQWHGIEPLMQV